MNKKIISFVLALCMVFSMNTLAYGARNVSITIDGSQVVFTQSTGAPFIDANNRTQVPLRVTMETFGCQVDWNKTTRIATVSKDDIKVEVPMNTKYIYANGKTKVIDTQSVVVNDRIYLPIRFVLEEFGAKVEWDNKSSTVIITRGAGESSKQTPSSPSAPGELSSVEISKKCSESVFTLVTYGLNGAQYGTGSAFFITSDGYAVTNGHVTSNAQFLKAITSDGKEYKDVDVVDVDTDHDLAMIKVKGSNFKPVEIDSTSSLVQGQNVYAIGSPYGLDNTMSNGIISNPKREINKLDYIQISVPIDHGSSGGVLLSTEGKVIGITSAGFESQANLNLAIPSKYISNLKKGTTPMFIYDYIDDNTNFIGLFGQMTGMVLEHQAQIQNGYEMTYLLNDVHDNKEYNYTKEDAIKEIEEKVPQEFKASGFTYNDLGRFTDGLQGVFTKDKHNIAIGMTQDGKLLVDYVLAPVYSSRYAVPSFEGLTGLTGETDEDEKSVQFIYQIPDVYQEKYFNAYVAVLTELGYVQTNKDVTNGANVIYLSNTKYEVGIATIDNALIIAVKK